MGKQNAVVDRSAVRESAIQAYERLESLDLSAITSDELARSIEREAVRLFGLRSARLDEESSHGEMAATEHGVVIPLAGMDLVGEGEVFTGWQAQARMFAAQVGSLIRAHRALVLNRRHEEEISALYATVAQLTARRDLAAVLKTVVERTRELLGSDIAYIMLLDEGGSTLRMRVAAGNQSAAFMQLERPVRPGVSAYAGTTVTSPDFLNDRELDHHGATDDLVRLEGVRSVLGVPLRTQLASLGTLCVANRFVKDFSQGEIALLSSLAEHAALALDNARLYEDAVSAAAASAEARAEAESHLERLERVESVHQKLTEVLLEGHGVSGVASTLAESFAAGLLITDWRQRPLADFGSGLTDRQGVVSVALLRRPDVVAALNRCSADFQTVTIGQDIVVAPISARRELLGFIWARRSRRDRQDEALRTSIEQAARVVALEMLREREAVETERRLRRDFMYELLSDHFADPVALEPRARQVWRDYGSEHRPLVISVLSRSAVGGSPIERARRLLSDGRSADLVTIHGMYLIVLTTVTQRDRVLAESEAIREVLAHNGMEAGIAIGPTCRVLKDTRSAILTARHLLELLSPRRILWTEGLEPLALLFESSSGERLDAFVQRTLAPLRGKEELMATLAAYYDSAGNRADASRTLGIHVNTLRGRLDRIEQMIGGSVDEAARAVPLRLALLARGMAAGA